MDKYTNNKILIIDDDEDICEVLQTHISNKISASIKAVTSGAAGIEFAKNNQIDLLITDLKVPDMHGFDIIESLSKINPNLVVIVATGFGDMNAFKEALRNQVYDLLEKPIEPELVIHKVQGALDQFNNNRTIERLARMAVINFYKFKTEDEYDEMSEQEKKDLRNRVIAICHQE